MTKQKEDESALLFRQLSVDKALDSILWIGRDGEILYVNESACTTTGYSREELLSMTVFDIDAHLSVERRERNWALRKETGAIYIETNFRKKDGRIYPVELSTCYMEYNGKEYSCVIVRDITERKQSEEALRKSEEKYRRIIDTATEGITAADEHFYITYVNKRFAQMLGYDPQEIVGTRIDAFMFEEDTPDLLERRARRSQGISEQFERKFRRKDGASLWTYVSSTSVIDADGRFKGGFAMYTDITERKRAEEALRESEEYFRSLIENSTDNIMVFDADNIMRYQSPSVERSLGYKHEETIGQKRGSVIAIHPNDVALLISDIEKAMRNPGVAVGPREARFRHKDGSWQWREVLNMAVAQKSGHMILVGNSRDVTERKQAEDALRKSEEKHRRIVDTTSEGIWTLDENFTITYVNERMAEMLCYEPDEMIGKNADPFSFKEDIPAALERRERRRQGVWEQFERRFRRKDGSPLWVHVSVTPVTDESGRLVGAFAMHTDITQRKEAEEALRKSEEKYRSIFENAVEGIYQSTLDGRFISVNPAMARMYGYESPEEMMLSVTDIAKQLYVKRGEMAEHKRLLDEHGMVKDIMTQSPKKDGSIMWASLSAHTVKDASGKVLYYEGTVEDITARKNAEEEKARLESQLLQSQKMEAIGTLAGGIAHDFNNILTALIGYGTLLRMNLDEDNPLRMYADQILSSSEKAAQLTQSLLAFSRKQPISLKPVKLNDIIKGTEKLLKRLLTEDIALKTILTADDITILGDITQIDQILINLATNARDAMPQGGVLNVETREVELDNRFIMSHGYGRIGRYALLSVVDTGTGMDEATRKRIFDPFFTTKEVGKGTGLGLSTVYGIVKQHNGYINVDSRPGQGTTFGIYLPASKGTMEDVKPASPAVKKGTETILIAEDNLVVRHLASEVLAISGYSVIEAVDGEDAIKKFRERQNSIALIILDVVMPKKNGKEVFEETKKIRPDIKVIFTSGYTGDVVLDKGIRDDTVDFVSKPLLPKELLLKVRTVLDR